MDSYRIAGDTDLDVITKYVWNMVLSEALCPSLQTLEVALRNNIHDAASKAFGNQFWFDSTPSLLRPGEQKLVANAKVQLTREGKPIEAGRVVAELTFGFWTSLLDVFYERTVWQPLLADKAAFAYMPKTIRTRATLSRRFNGIRKLRSRVFHHEPVWNDAYLSRSHADIVEAIRWICPELYDMTNLLDRFPQVYSPACRNQLRMLLNR